MISQKHKLLVELFFVGYFFVLPILLLVTSSVVSVGVWFLSAPLILSFISKGKQGGRS